jgi:hypothetical protein
MYTYIFMDIIGVTTGSFATELRSPSCLRSDAPEPKWNKA